jgi:hypothetical protein
MHKTLFLLLFLLSPDIIFPQQDKTFSNHRQIDSLQKLLSGTKAEDRVNILNKLASCYAGENFDSSIIFSIRAARLATQFGYTKGIGLARYNTGNAYYYKLDFKNALISYLSAQSILEKGDYGKELGDVNLMIGNINYSIRRGDKAVSSYKKALGYYSEAGSEGSLMAVYDVLNVAIFFLDYGPIDSALVYGFKLLDLSRKHQDHYREAKTLMNIGMCYSFSEKSVAEKQKTLLYCDSAMKEASSIKNDILISIIESIRGNYYDYMTPFFDLTGDLSLARYNYEKAYNVSLRTGCNWLKATWLNRLAMLDLAEKEYGNARIHLDLSEASLKDFYERDWKNMPGQGYIVSALGKISDYFMAQRERYVLYRSLYKLAVAVGDHREAVENLNLYYEAKDSMFATQQGKQLELLMAEDEAEKQQQKLQTLAKDNELNRLQLSRTRFIFIGIGAGILLVSLILLLFFQRRKLGAEQRSVSMEQRLLRAQMNPHFIFNSLASIQNFVINENSDQASVYLSKFSQLVRNILDNSVEEYVPLEKEINTIENYLELQKVRYGGKFDFKIIIDEKIDQENMLIPPMLSQPFIENAIEHGIRHKKTPGKIEIRFQLTLGFIRVEVEDDGVGREKAHEIESKQKTRHRSMAISITRDRLNILNKKLKQKIRMEITDLKDVSGQGCGTRVEFGIPVVVK